MESFKIPGALRVRLGRVFCLYDDIARNSIVQPNASLTAKAAFGLAAIASISGRVKRSSLKEYTHVANNRPINANPKHISNEFAAKVAAITALMRTTGRDSISIQYQDQTSRTRQISCLSTRGFSAVLDTNG